MSEDFEALLERVRSEARGRTASEPAHDWLHVLRVESLGRRIATVESADASVVSAAALLHEIVALPKDHPDSHRAGALCAEAARSVLVELRAPDAFTAAVCHCIEVHAFSAGLEPGTLEARVLQDADRLDAIGAIGIARCFATTAAMGRPFYDGNDPFAERRELDDKAFGLDHFAKKLLRIPARLHTREARRIGRERAAFIEAYLQQLRTEIYS